MDVLATTGVSDYLALKQLNLKAQVNVRVLKSADDVARQQAQQLLELLEPGKGANINIRA